MDGKQHLVEGVQIKYLCALVWATVMWSELAQAQTNNPFQPFSWEWPTPNDARLASGAPGPNYWQQVADYNISVVLDDVRHRLTGDETVTYHNHSPHTLTYLWMQLDQNLRRPDAMIRQLEQGKSFANPSQFDRHFAPEPTFKGGIEDLQVTRNGRPVTHTVVETNMRIDLAQPLKPGDTVQLQLHWSYAINDARAAEGRSGYEYFPADGNYIYEIAQFYPRMCVYDDVKGWENQPFFGPAEFGLEFGDFDLRIDAPEDHVVVASGNLQNAKEVLTKEQQQRLETIAQHPGHPQFIVKPEEAKANQKSKAKGRKVWHFQAKNVRDVAFASSRKFAWDAAYIQMGDRKVLTQSLYPNEAIPLWDKYATHAIIHTLQTYSRLAMDYPYDVATAVHGPVWGMEYPTLAFCGGRPTSSGYYSRQAKYLMIGVVIHEVGHNYFPMIVNSNERRWAWMDEGLNSFCQIIAEQTFERGFPLRRGSADKIAEFMLSSDHQPIMTNPESIRDNASLSYEKTAVGLYILRQEVMGATAFDMAFKEYARRWAFRHPEPADFFRTLEDASGHALSWFWRTWFYEAQPLEMGIGKVKHYLLAKNRAAKGYVDPHQIPMPGPTTWSCYSDDKPELEDHYTGMESTSAEANDEFLRDLLQQAQSRPDTTNAFHAYQVIVERNGGCILPVQVQAVFADGSRVRYRLPAEVWMQGNQTFVKEIYSDRPILAFVLDPDHLIPDTDRSNDIFPRENGRQQFETADLRK
ncbi:MAG TPA: M1 family metallopeptidase [Bacteroidia bacterium]|nr:M1 family metallopeptidase [Bacteroidia bacterium]